MTFMQFINTIKVCPSCTGGLYVDVDLGASRLRCVDGCAGYFERANTPNGVPSSVEYKTK